NGFLSKEMFFTVMLNVSEFNLFSLDSTSVLFPIIAWIASIFTFIYSMIIVFKTFLGKPKEKNIQEAKEASFGMLISPFDLSIFLFPFLALIAIIFPLIYSMIIVFKTFLGKPKEKNIQEAKEASFGMLLAPSILAISIIVIFLFPNILADNILRPALASI